MTDIPGTMAALTFAFAGGAAFGAAYFALLWHNTRRLTAGNFGAAGAVLGFAGRLILAAAVIVIVLKSGATAGQMLVAVLGFTLARQVWLRRRDPRERDGTAWK